MNKVKYFLILGFVFIASIFVSNEVFAEDCSIRICKINGCTLSGTSCNEDVVCQTVRCDSNCTYYTDIADGCYLNTDAEEGCMDWQWDSCLTTKKTTTEVCHWETEWNWYCPPVILQSPEREIFSSVSKVYAVPIVDPGPDPVCYWKSTSVKVCEDKTTTTCVGGLYCPDGQEVTTETYSCKILNWNPRTVACIPDDDGGGDTTVNVNPSCTCTVNNSCNPPACSVGEIDFDTGDGVGTDTTCSYTNGDCVGNTTQCARDTDSRQCWIENNTQPTGTVAINTGSTSETNLGCVSITTTGQVVNNPLPVTLTYTDVDSVDEIEAISVWFDQDSTIPNITTVSPSVADPRLHNNGEFGILFRRLSANDWTDTDIYISDYNGGSWQWVRRGSIGVGTRARLDGENGLDMLFINDVIVTKGANVTIDFNIEFLNETSGVADYEEVDAGDFGVYTMGLDWLGFTPYGDDNIRFSNLWTGKILTWIIDMEPPVAEGFSYNIVTAESISLDWIFSDDSSIVRVIGNASVLDAGFTNGFIDNVGVTTDYDVRIPRVYDDTFYDSTNNLWSVDGVASRSENINLRDNEGGSLEFTSYAFDSACNVTDTSTVISLETAWITTKAGILFSQGGTRLNVNEYVAGPEEPLSNDDYWLDQYNFYKDQVDISTEFVSGGSDTLNALIYDVKLGSVRATNYYDRNNKQQYWYNFFKDRFNSKLEEAGDVLGLYAFIIEPEPEPEPKPEPESPSTFVVLNKPDKMIIGTGASATSFGCTEGLLCVVNVAGDLTIESNFTIDTKVAFLVDGNLTIHPDIKNADSSSVGFFMSGGNIYVKEGTYKSGASTYPKYDVIEGFFLADGQIILEEGDIGQDIRDGLKINGSILGFDDSLGSSIVLQRTLKLKDNLAFPAAAIHYDKRYLRVAPYFFGGERDTFKQEVGYKPL